MSRLAPPRCVRFPLDIDAELMARARNENLTVSELLQAFALGVIHNTQPSVDEGYRQAKSVAMQLATEALHTALAEMPETFAEAHQAVANGQPLQRRMRRG